jgi:hypothetical protein
MLKQYDDLAPAGCRLVTVHCAAAGKHARLDCNAINW